jgi:toxin CcdB
MQRFDVFLTAEGVCLINLQSEFLSDLTTTIVAPLVPAKTIKAPVTRLNPVFHIGDASYVMRTQFMSSISKSALKTNIASLAHKHAEIVNAIDMLFEGF